MKRFFSIISWIIFTLSFWYSFSVSAFDVNSIQLTDSPVAPNTELNIKSAQAIEKYLMSYKNELLTFEDTYGLKNDVVIQNSVNEVTEMIFWLRKIQTNMVEKFTAELTMSQCIEGIKKLNTTLKKYLQNIAETALAETKKYQDALYKNTLVSVSKKLDMVISIFKKKTEGKRLLSKQETLYNQHIAILEWENKKLKNFDKFFFKNKADLLFTLRSILGKIKSEVAIIKSLQ